MLQNPFQAEKELDGLSKVLVDVKQPLLYAGAAVFLAVAALLGSLVGTKVPGEHDKFSDVGVVSLYGTRLCQQLQLTIPHCCPTTFLQRP